jgi:hypothetical protein
MCCAHRKIFFDTTDQIPVSYDCAIGSPFEVEPVGQFDQRVRGLQFVIAIGATAGHVQEQIQLGGGGQRKQ